MPNALWGLLIAVSTLAAMEAVAWATHKYLMHGPMWTWHASHHSKRYGPFEKNDLFGVVFSVMAIAIFALGLLWWPLFWIGLGVTGYGLVYTLFHDMLVHDRFGRVAKPRRGYLGRIIEAHHLHHAVHTREGAVSFGFLWTASPESLRAELSSRRSRIEADPAKEPRPDPENPSAMST